MNMATAEFSVDERALLKESVDQFVATAYSFEKRRAYVAAAKPYSRQIWKEMSALGWLGIGLPEEAGGLGGVAELCVVSEAIGRGMLLEPYVSTIVCARLIAKLGSAEQRIMLSKIVSGESILALAYAEPQLGYARCPAGTLAKEGRITGSKQAALDAPVATAIVVSARETNGNTGLYLVDPGATGVSLQSYATVDDRTAANIILDNVATERLGSGGDASEALDEALDEASVVIAAEAVGAMAAALAMTVDYLKQREQFGQKLASFQTLRHRLVDMYVALRETEAMTDVALAALGHEGDERCASVSALKVWVCRSARFVAQNAVQLHGAMGVTDELAISHWFKRLMMIESLFGDADFHVERYARASQAVDVTE